jgi:hypothetical protein
MGYSEAKTIVDFLVTFAVMVEQSKKVTPLLMEEFLLAIFSPYTNCMVTILLFDTSIFWWLIFPSQY